MIGNNRMNWGKEFEDSVYDRIYDLDRDQISKLAAESIDVESVYRVLNKRTFFLKASDYQLFLTKCLFIA